MSLSIFNFKKGQRIKIPTAFMGFCIFVILTEGIVAAYFPKASRPPLEHELLLVQKDIARNVPMNKDVLVFGDSSSIYAIEPSVIQKVTQKSAYTFGSFGEATMAVNYWILRDYLKSNEPPKQILLMIILPNWQNGMHRDSVVNVLAFSYLENFFEIIPGIELNEKWITCIGNWLKFALPSQRFRFQIRYFLKDRTPFGQHAATQKAFNISRALLLKSLGNYRHYRDLNLKKKNKIKDPRELTASAFADKATAEAKAKRLGIAEKGFVISHLNSMYLKRFLHLARSHGIDVFWCHAPLIRQGDETIATPLKIQGYLSFVRQQVKEHDNLHLLTKDISYISPEQVHDTVHHLRYKDSVRFTVFLSKQLMRFRQESRSKP